MKKLKSFDGIAISISTGNAEIASGGVTCASSSEECDVEGSIDRRSDQEGSDSKSKRSPEGICQSKEILETVKYKPILVMREKKKVIYWAVSNRYFTCSARTGFQRFQ